MRRRPLGRDSKSFTEYRTASRIAAPSSPGVNFFSLSDTLAASSVKSWNVSRAVKCDQSHLTLCLINKGFQHRAEAAYGRRAGAFP